MRTFKRKRGFLTVAQNGKHDYLRMAYALALSLKASQKEHGYLSVMVTPGTDIPSNYRRVFDEVIEIPWTDSAKEAEWKLQNEWKVYHVSPYEETIKLDGDMLFTSDVSDWWDVMAMSDLSFCHKVRNFRGELATSDYYRETFTSNRLKNVYSAFMFFRYSDFSQAFFETAEDIFNNWKTFFFKYLDESRPDYVSTDLVYALACRVLDIEDDVILPHAVPTFVHMKSRMQDFGEVRIGEDWIRHIPVSLTPDLSLHVGTYKQVYPLHYHLKEFLTDEMIRTYERNLGL